MAAYFDVPNLVAGTYDVIVSSAGFTTEKVSGVTLDIGAEREVKVQLKVGDQSIQVVVTRGQASTVDLVSSITMPVVDDHTIVQDCR